MNSNLLVKKEYIDKTRKYLTYLSSRVDDIDSIKLEIKDLKLKANLSYREVRFDELGIKSQGPTRGIDDMVISAKDMIYIKEGEIENIKIKFNFVKSILLKMCKVDRNIIEYKYFIKNKSNKQHTIAEIAKIVNYSNATVKRKELKAIQEIAYKLYGDIVFVEVEPILSHTRAI